MAQLKAGKPSLQEDPPAEVDHLTNHDPATGQLPPQRGQKHTRGDDPPVFQHNNKQPKTSQQEDNPPGDCPSHNAPSTQHPTLVNDRSGPYPTWTTKDTPSYILDRLCPWIKEIPPRLTSRLLWESSGHTPEELSGPTALILYAGADDSYSLKSAMLSLSKTWPMTILEVDNKRPDKEISDDMLLGEPYGALCRGALQGHIRVEGGPIAGLGLSSDGSRNRGHLFQLGTGRQPIHGVFQSSLTKIRWTQTTTVFFCYDSWCS